MTRSHRPTLYSYAASLAGCLALAYALIPTGPLDLVPTTSGSNASGVLDTTLLAKATEMSTAMSTATMQANELSGPQTGFFVPNLGQWNHRARFVHRSGPMTLYLEDRGWTIDLAKREAKAEPLMPGSHMSDRTKNANHREGMKYRGVALSMTFEGDASVSGILGEQKLAGHHNYFLGSNEQNWRTGVPLYSSVLYSDLYPGVDLRLREAKGVPEYDLLLQPGADLSLVSVRIKGALGMSIDDEGSLVIETALGPLTQPVPKTWQVDEDGNKSQVLCRFVLLGANRFGFSAPGWDGDASLTIDPGLIWSTFVSGSHIDRVKALSVDKSGVVTIAGRTFSSNYPVTLSAYDRSYEGISDAFITQLDPSKTGKAQLVYSTFLGGHGWTDISSLSVDTSGVVTVAGSTHSATFPTTKGAFDRNQHFSPDVFVSRLDPSKTGKAQLLYSTLLGGANYDFAYGLSINARGVVAVTGSTSSTKFPTTKGALDTTLSGSSDAFLSLLDPSKIGKAQLLYSTYLGGSSYEAAYAVSVDAKNVMTLVGGTASARFPTTIGAFDRSYGGAGWRWLRDVFVSRVDPAKTGAAQLLYSSYLGGTGSEHALALSVDTNGVITLAGGTSSKTFPTTPGAYDTSHNGQDTDDAFVTRLDPSKTGKAQLLYSTFLGGTGFEFPGDLHVDAKGILTIAGGTISTDFPTTVGAYSRKKKAYTDAFASRLDPSKTGAAQLLYSTYLGGHLHDGARSLRHGMSSPRSVRFHPAQSEEASMKQWLHLRFFGLTSAKLNSTELNSSRDASS